MKTTMIRSLQFLALAISLAALSTGCSSMKSRNVAEGGGAGYGTGESSDGGIGLGTLQRVHFGFDKSVIAGEAADILKKNAKIIKGNSKMRVLIEGHCDERGTNEYNVALGERRAKATLDYLSSLGVQRSRLENKSWGEERPLDTDKSESAFAANRRAEFVILAK